MFYDVTIHPVLNGYLVTVGCQQVVFTSMDDLLTELQRYLETPEKIIKEYWEEAINAPHVFPILAQEARLIDQGIARAYEQMRAETQQAIAANPSAAERYPTRVRPEIVPDDGSGSPADGH